MTSVTIKCDGCQREAQAEWSKHSQSWHKPRSWYQRSDEDGPQVACCRKCLEQVAKDTGKSPCVLPV